MLLTKLFENSGGGMSDKLKLRIYFSDFFRVSPSDLMAYGAFDVSLINDLPLFIDPFLLFNSKKTEYQELHAAIISYVAFLQENTKKAENSNGLTQPWFMFPEVKETWLGWSEIGNAGAGLGPKFAKSLQLSLPRVFPHGLGQSENESPHLEKLCLVRDGVGRDNISDLTTNLIKNFLCEYTQAFADLYLEPRLVKKFMVSKVGFNYETETWLSREFKLPAYGNEFVLLTPRDILTKDETWINKHELLHRLSTYDGIAAAIPNQQLREQVNNYLGKRLSENTPEKKRRKVLLEMLEQFPQILESYIQDKEVHGAQATAASAEKVAQAQEIFIENLRRFANALLERTGFYDVAGVTKEEARARVMFLKTFIEDMDGWRVFYHNGRAIGAEKDLQLIFKLTWFATPLDVNSEVNNGRGPVDFAVSFGSGDKTLVEFKLARNKKLRANLENQVEIYKAASKAKGALKVILYYSEKELKKVKDLVKELSLDGDPDIILIDARADNKQSASNVH